MSVTALRVQHQRPRRDPAAAERAAADFLTALGVDLSADGLADTPGRMARAYAELLTPREFQLTTFDNDEGYDELVLARGIPIRSVCEHHLLPFVGVAHVGYDPAVIPDDYADGRTMAELSPAEKDAISHRGRAARALVVLLAREDGAGC